MSEIDPNTSGADGSGPPTIEQPSLKPAIEPEILRSLSGYELLEEIGRGGMGIVYLAEQKEPVRRRVALKIIKLGMDSKEVVARFEAERQALALMDHPNIAKVLDAGATPLGQPYFVMELVHGTKLTEYCDRHKLTTRQRLDLFLPVCRAIQHAHQKGIIHRDIKPSNILVSEQDGVPVPKVIDFGIAKAMGQSLTDSTVFTAASQIIGTPAYMSPEQAEGSLDIDTRSDIYALGVLLYELLTARTPFEARDLIRAGIDDMRRRIREEEPPRPSTRLTALTGPELTSLARSRQAEPAKLINLLRGDLDWIVMKAIEKDRTRRYETANGLAMDIQRHLANEPVEARPPSRSYRLQKLVRRNKLAFGSAAAVAVALLAGLGLSTVFYLNERAAHLAEARERKLAEERRQQAEMSEKQAVQQKQIAEAVGNFLRQDLLRQADATEQANTLGELGAGFELKENPTIKELLDRTALGLAPDKIEKTFPGQPQVQASILRTVGLTYDGIGNYVQAIEFLSRAAKVYADALGPENPETLNTLRDQAESYLSAGKFPRAIDILERVRDVQLKKLGADHLDTLTTIQNLATAYDAVGELPKAIELFEHVRAAWIKKLGPEHTDTLGVEHNLALAYHHAHKLDQAIPLFEHVRDAALKKLGPDHPNTLIVVHNLARAYQDAGRLTDAIAMFERVRNARLKTLGPEHPETLRIIQNLAVAYSAMGQWERALPLFLQAAEGFEKRKLADDDAADAVWSLVGCFERLQRESEAQAWVDKLLASVKEQEGAESTAYAKVLAYFGWHLLQRQQWARAETVLRHCLDLREKLQLEGWATYSIRSMLGGALLGQKQFAQAEPLLLAGCQGLRQHQQEIPAPDKFPLREALQRLVELYEDWAKAEPNSGWQDKATPWRQELQALK